MSPPTGAAAPTQPPRLRPPRSPTMAFIDSHFLQRAVCRAVRLSPHDQRLDVGAVRDWLVAGALGAIEPGACRRVYWYDGAFDRGHPNAEGQQRFLHAISQLDLVQPRLGSLSEVTPDWHREVREALTAIAVPVDRFEAHLPLLPSLRQKGVDIKLALDFVRLAERGAISHALLLAGDSDFVPAIEIARDAGVLITLLTPVDTRPAARLTALADTTIEIPANVAAGLLRGRTPATQIATRQESTSETAPAAESPRRRTRRSARGGSPDRPALRAIEGRPPATNEADDTAPASVPEPRRESFAIAERAGFTVVDSEGTVRLYLTPLSDDGTFVVRRERDGRRETLATVSVLAEPAVQAA
jgi:uncharacterized LabA/DUF88 family protein